MEGVWRQTCCSDASSWETFILALANIHTPTHTHITTHICCPELRAVPTSCCPIISEPVPHEHRGNFGASLISHHPSRAMAGIQYEGWTALRTRKCPPTEREDGIADKGESSNHKALFKGQSSMDRFPTSHLCVYVFCLIRVCVSSLYVRCLVSVQTAGPQIRSKSHRLRSVWNREVLFGGQTDNETSCCLSFYYTSMQM